MPITIPFHFRKLDPLKEVAVERKVATLQVPFLASTKVALTRSETPLRSKTLRAIAAALAVVDAGEALTTAREAQENPEVVLGATLEGDALNKLKVLAAAVTGAEKNKDDAVEISSTVRSAAAVVGADPYLTAVAVKTIQENDPPGTGRTMLAAALIWVAAIDYRLLENAPKAGVKDRMLNHVQASLESTEALEVRIKKLEDAVRELQAKLSTSTAPV